MVNERWSKCYYLFYIRDRPIWIFQCRCRYRFFFISLSRWPIRAADFLEPIFGADTAFAHSIYIIKILHIASKTAWKAQPRRFLLSTSAYAPVASVVAMQPWTALSTMTRKYQQRILISSPLLLHIFMEMRNKNPPCPAMISCSAELSMLSWKGRLFFVTWPAFACGILKSWDVFISPRHKRAWTNERAAPHARRNRVASFMSTRPNLSQVVAE